MFKFYHYNRWTRYWFVWMTRIFIKYIDTRSSEQPLSFPRLTLPSVGKVLASSADSRIIDKLPASPEKVKSFSLENLQQNQFCNTKIMISSKYHQDLIKLSWYHHDIIKISWYKHNIIKLSSRYHHIIIIKSRYYQDIMISSWIIKISWYQQDIIKKSSRYHDIINISWI